MVKKKEEKEKSQSILESSKEVNELINSLQEKSIERVTEIINLLEQDREAIRYCAEYGISPENTFRAIINRNGEERELKAFVSGEEGSEVLRREMNELIKQGEFAVKNRTVRRFKPDKKRLLNRLKEEGVI